MAILLLQIDDIASEIFSFFTVVSPLGIHLMRWRCLADSGWRLLKSVVYHRDVYQTSSLLMKIKSYYCFQPYPWLDLVLVYRYT